MSVASFMFFSAMAFVGPVQNPHGFRPVGVFCDVCNVNLLVWQCYACGGQYCGRCIFRHRRIPGASVEDLDSGLISGNEVAEGMHIIFRRIWQRLSSDMATDPAEANASFCRLYLCMSTNGCLAFEFQ